MGVQAGQSRICKRVVCELPGQSRSNRCSYMESVVIAYLWCEACGTIIAATKQSSTLALASRLPLRVMLCDDNLINQKVALRLLQQMGYKADVANNGLECLMALDRQPYDLIFMDVQNAGDGRSGSDTPDPGNDRSRNRRLNIFRNQIAIVANDGQCHAGRQGKMPCRWHGRLCGQACASGRHPPNAGTMGFCGRWLWEPGAGDQQPAHRLESCEGGGEEPLSGHGAVAGLTANGDPKNLRDLSRALHPADRQTNCAA